MPRFLCLAVTDNGDLTAAIVNDTTGQHLPYGDHGAIINRMQDVSELTAIVELPDDDFRPEVIDPTADSEAPVSFLDL